jgi:RNA polymerase sigma-70 factor (ECF subfamily)
VELDLSGLAFVAWEAARGLAALRREGVGLRGGSGFVRELLRAAADESSRGARPSADGRARGGSMRDPNLSSERASRTGEADELARLRAGDDAAFAALVRRESPRLLAVARRILRSDEEANDAVQDAFVAAWRKLASFEGEARLSTWLHRIAVNAALMRLRSRRRRREQPIEELLPRFAEDGHHAHSVPAWTPHEACSLERAEVRAAVRECIDRLPERYRLALVLRDVEGLDTAEAAAALGIRPDALKMRLHRARQALRTLLEPYRLAAEPPGGDGLQNFRFSNSPGSRSGSRELRARPRGESEYLKI